MKKKPIQAWTSRHRAIRIRFFVRDSHLLLRKIVSENLDKSVSAEKESGTPFNTIPSSDLIGLFLSKQLAGRTPIYSHRAAKGNKKPSFEFGRTDFSLRWQDLTNQINLNLNISAYLEVGKPKKDARCKDENRSSVSLVSSFFDLVHCVVI